MKKLASLLLVAVAAFACARSASAQESAGDVSASSSLLHRPAPSPSAGPAAGSGENKPLDAHLSKDDKGKTVTTTFATTDAKIYLIWSDGADPKGGKVKVVWKSEAGKKLFEGEEPLKGPGTVGSFNLTAPSSGFPAGQYSVELSVGSKVLKTLKFTIKK